MTLEGRRDDRVCPECGGVFTRSAVRLRQRYCSTTCSTAAHQRSLAKSAARRTRAKAKALSLELQACRSAGISSAAADAQGEFFVVVVRATEKLAMRLAVVAGEGSVVIVERCYRVGWDWFVDGGDGRRVLIGRRQTDGPRTDAERERAALLRDVDGPVDNHGL